MTTEYTVYDRRDGRLAGKSYQPDTSAASEMAAIRAAGVPPQFAEVDVRALSDEAAREYVGGAYTRYTRRD